MNSIQRTVICMCMTVATAGLSWAQGWHGIVPLRSTREDVRRLLGSPAELGQRSYDLYDLANEVAYISYSSGPCNGRWNVPRGTVISVSVAPKTELLVADLRLDEGGYKRRTDPHVSGITYYTDEEAGVTVEAAGDKVMKVYYDPAARDNHLRCPGNPHVTPMAERAPAQVFDKIDVYGDLPFEKEKEHLDHLALQLQNMPDMRGFIIAYAGRRARAGEAQARAECAKNYLVNERGIEARRIVAMDGGYREEFTVDLYLVPRGAAGPTATPTVDPSEVQIIKSGSARNSRRSTRARCKR